jgi:predicted Rossmann fold flavoprotein
VSSSFDAIIIGGGAAGLFCAFTAGRRGKRVLVIEHNGEVGRKIIISGGGRCNFTNTNVSAENFVSQNRHFAKSALSRYTPKDFIDLVRSHGIAYYEKTLGQLFCRDSSRQIVDLLLTECERANVRIETACSVIHVRDGGDFQVETTKGAFSSQNLVVACGGLSFPKIGATDLGYRLARQFGLKIVETRPSLVALVAKQQGFQNLAGVSVPVEVSTNGTSFRENLLFTHRGMSGPAILQISNYWKPDNDVEIDLIPQITREDFMDAAARSRQQPVNFLAQMVPSKLATRLAEGLGQVEIRSLGARKVEALSDQLKNYRVAFASTEGYDRAEVTLGGVSTDGLSSQTMESKKRKGLYFIGEVVDVTGWLGGYNFQWAWSSGHACGSSI